MPQAHCTHRLTLRHPAGFAALFCAITLLASSMAAQTLSERVDLEATKQIRDAALNQSQVMEMVAELSDARGPRLTGSPGLKRAEEYARDKLREWGLANAHLEAWGPFGRGWSLEGFTANMTSPAFTRLIAYGRNSRSLSAGQRGGGADFRRMVGAVEGFGSHHPVPCQYWRD